VIREGDIMQCPSCGYDNQEDAEYCNLCQYSFLMPREQSPPIPGIPSVTEELSDLPDLPVEELNWLERHLNLTWILAYFACIAAFLVLAIPLLVITGRPLLFFTDGSIVLPLYITILSWFFGLFWFFGVGGWVLLRKNRSLAWLFLTLILGPIGWIIFLCLRNKSDELFTAPRSAPTMSPTRASPSHP
jgi:hypothetical protein